MHGLVLGLHNVFRWVVLIAAVVVLIRVYRGLATGAPWTRREAVSLSGYSAMISLEMLFGLVLYFVLSPQGMRALSDMSAAMRDADTRFFAIEHPVTMMLAVGLAHVAVARTRKATTDAQRYRSAALLVTLSLLLLLARIPWARPLVPSF